jgi:hypothetical protein
MTEYPIKKKSFNKLLTTTNPQIPPHHHHHHHHHFTFLHKNHNQETEPKGKTKKMGHVYIL